MKRNFAEWNQIIWNSRLLSFQQCNELGFLTGNTNNYNKRFTRPHKIYSAQILPFLLFGCKFSAYISSGYLRSKIWMFERLFIIILKQMMRYAMWFDCVVLCYASWTNVSVYGDGNEYQAVAQYNWRVRNVVALALPFKSVLK